MPLFGGKWVLLGELAGPGNKKSCGLESWNENDGRSSDPSTQKRKKGPPTATRSSSIAVNMSFTAKPCVREFRGGSVGKSGRR